MTSRLKGNPYTTQSGYSMNLLLLYDPVRANFTTFQMKVTFYMYLRIVSYKGELLLYCYDGSSSFVTDDILREIFVNFRRAKSLRGNDRRWDSENDSILDAPGQTLAYVSKKNELCIVDSNPFAKLISEVTRNEYISAAEYAKRKKKSVARIKRLCAEERITGALKKGGSWFIPKSTPYPKDKRKK